MNLILLYGSVIIAGIIVGRKARTVYQVLLVLTSISWVLLVTSLVLFYHFLYLNELFIMLCVFIVLFMTLILYGKEIFMSAEEIIKNVTAMIYNMIIVYTVTLGGLIIAFRLMYPFENPNILPDVTYISYPLLFALLLMLFIWGIRHLLHHKVWRIRYITKGAQMITVLSIVLILNACNIFYQDNPFEPGNPSESLYEGIEYYEIYNATSIHTPMVEESNRASVQDYYYTDDSLYLTIEYEYHYTISEDSTYVCYQLARDTLEVIDSIEVPLFLNFLGETDSTIIYKDFNQSIKSLDGLIDISIDKNIFKYEITENQLRMIAATSDNDNVIIDEYIYDVDAQELTITNDIVYSTGRVLYDLNGDAITTTYEQYNLYEDEDVMYFTDSKRGRDVYRYRNGEVSLFLTDQDFSEFAVTKHGILTADQREASMYSTEGEMIGKVYLDRASLTNTNYHYVVHDVLEDGTFRYISLEISNDELSISYMDLHKPHINLYLQYFMSPFVGLFLLIGILPMNEIGYTFKKH